MYLFISLHNKHLLKISVNLPFPPNKNITLSQLWTFDPWNLKVSISNGMAESLLVAPLDTGRRGGCFDARCERGFAGSTLAIFRRNSCRLDMGLGEADALFRSLSLRNLTKVHRTVNQTPITIEKMEVSNAGFEEKLPVAIQPENSVPSLNWVTLPRLQFCQQLGDVTHGWILI